MTVADPVRSPLAYRAIDTPGLNEANEALIAVSYTHLRAHETVLDIVCRLLLEKKKNNKYKKKQHKSNYLQDNNKYIH